MITTSSMFRITPTGFIGAAVAIYVIALAATFALHLAGVSELTSFALPGIVAALFVAAFVWRPHETVVAFALYLLLYETVARWTHASVQHVDELVVPAFLGITWIRAGRSFAITSWVKGVSLGVVVVVGIASSLASAVPLEVWGPGLLLLLKGIAMYYTVRWLAWRPDHLPGVLRIVLAAAGILLALAALESLNPAAFQQTFGLRELASERGGLPTLKSLFFHPVLFAWFMVFAGLFCYAYFIVFRRWWMLVAALLFTTGAILSGRRKAIAGAVLALAVAFVHTLLDRRGWRSVVRVWTPITAGVVGVTILFLPLLVDLTETTLDRYVPDVGVVTSLPSAPATPGDPERRFARGTPPRVALYVVSVAVAADHFPLGAGVGRYGSHMSRVQFSPLYHEYGLTSVAGLRPQNPAAVTDTFWPSLLGELGVFGALAYAAFIASVAVDNWRASRTLGPPTARAFALGATLVLAEAIAESLAAPMFAAPSATVFVLGVAGIVASLARTASEAESTPG